MSLLAGGVLGNALASLGRVPGECSIDGLPVPSVRSLCTMAFRWSSWTHTGPLKTDARSGVWLCAPRLSQTCKSHPIRGTLMLACLWY